MSNLMYASIILTAKDLKRLETPTDSGMARVGLLTTMMADAPGVKMCRLADDAQTFAMYFQIMVQYGNTGLVAEALRPWFGSVTFSEYVDGMMLNHQRIEHTEVH